ncbi:glutamate--cysteine ligase [Actinoplanes sp. NPDC049548]|uniref:carboxylate-amine ligase n=1 Tax=Actinoplanes sp. NPDC049548 TaxID=3155152 RepID=UPI003426EA0F
MSVAVGARPGANLTLGVEEEFLLLDPHSGGNAPVVEQVMDALPADVRGQSHLEFRRSMVEMVSLVRVDLADLRRELLVLRRAAAAAAAGAGARLVAVGATPVADPELTVPDKPRYRAMVRQYGPIASDPAVCGCHVHVGVPDRELAVQVCNHLRPWLPVVQALTVNSPVHAGADTGHASWRSMQLERWPSMGPTPRFDSAEDYDRTVEALIMSGVMLDPSMVYWYARPSVHYPTVEIRVGDVCPTVDDTILVAGLIRALVATVVDDVRAGRPAPELRDCLVSAAHWRAAHEGLDGTLTDLRSGRVRPAWDLVDELFAAVSPALLRHGDLSLVGAQLDRLRRQGTGATRQRRILRESGGLGAVLDELARQTVAD